MRIKVAELKKLITEEIQNMLPKAESRFRPQANPNITFEWYVEVPLPNGDSDQKTFIVHAHVEPGSPGSYDEPPSGGSVDIEGFTDEQGNQVPFEVILRLENEVVPITAQQLMDKMEEKAMEIGPDYDEPDPDRYRDDY